MTIDKRLLFVGGPEASGALLDLVGRQEIGSLLPVLATGCEKTLHTARPTWDLAAVQMTLPQILQPYCNL
eukprot:COSAG01_NODE_3504_length_5994_cov_47.750000_2_plen_70_part_00